MQAKPILVPFDLDLTLTIGMINRKSSTQNGPRSTIMLVALSGHGPDHARWAMASTPIKQDLHCVRTCPVHEQNQNLPFRRHGNHTSDSRHVDFETMSFPMMFWFHQLKENIHVQFYLGLNQTIHPKKVAGNFSQNLPV